MSGPPRLDFRAQFTAAPEWNKQLEEFFKQPVELKFSLGNLNYGSRKYDLKLTEPAKPATPAAAAEIPEVARLGSSFSILPNEGYRNGVWKLKVGERLIESYPVAAPFLDLGKIFGPRIAKPGWMNLSGSLGAS